MPLLENIALVRAKIAAAAREAGRDPAEITLCAATKVQSGQTIREAIAAGIQVCGENRVQEMTAHLDENAYEGARLHFIGHLQTNKVKYVVGRVDLIESVGSERLLLAIEERAARLGLRQEVLLEVNVGGELAKSGADPAEIHGLAALARSLPHIALRGLMCIPPAVVNAGDNRKFFAQTRHLFVDIRQGMKDNGFIMDCLSMGMSRDYEDAVREGATLVRVGTALFGPRPPVMKIQQGKL